MELSCRCIPTGTMGAAVGWGRASVGKFGICSVGAGWNKSRVSSIAVW